MDDLSGTDELLTASEVATFLRIPLTTVYKLVQESVVPGFKVGKHWRFRKTSLLEWIRQQEVKNPTVDQGESV